MKSTSFRRRVKATLVGTVAATLAALPVAIGAGPQPGQRIDMKMLIVQPPPALGVDPSLHWRSALDREGLPYDVVNRGSVNDNLLADYGANRAKYQGIIFTDGSLTDPNAAGYAPADIAAINKLQQTFGVRTVSDITYPNADRGFCPPAAPPSLPSSCANGALPTSGQVDGQTANLTADGLAIFPELTGPIPFPNIDPAVDETYAHQLAPQAITSGSYRSLMAGPNGTSSIMGVHTAADGREQLVLTFASNQWQTNNMLLRRGIVNWVTRGVHFGASRNHYSMQIDDIFSETARWNSTTNNTPGEDVPCGGAGQPVCVTDRMVPADTQATANFQNSKNFKFDFGFNGFYYREPGTPRATNDPLGDDPTWGLLQPSVRSQFRWFNHTWTHLKFDAPTGQPVPNLTEIVNEINLNKNFAAARALPVNNSELVTGEHSGIGSYPGFPINPNMGTALTQTATAWIGDDNSVQPAQRQIGSATTVPRYPSNVYYNVSNRTDQLDEYNYIYFENCSPPTTCRTSPATWAEYSDIESRIMLDHVLGNDPRLHYAHQSNLIQTGGNGILFGNDNQGVMDRVYAKYDTYVKRTGASAAPLINPTLSEAGMRMLEMTAWSTAKSTGGASGYIQDGKVYVQTTGSVAVPITGITGMAGATSYAGRTSGWTTVNGLAAFSVEGPSPTTLATISGNAYVGQTLTATPGTWPAGITVNRAWVQCDAAGNGCAVIPGASGTTYVPTSADRGKTIRYSEVGASALASAERPSAPSAVIKEPKLLAPPSLNGTPQAGQVLSVTPAVFQDVSSVNRNWQACDAAGANCADIAGATGATFSLTATQVGKRIRVVEAATGLPAGVGAPVGVSAPSPAIVAAGAPPPPPLGDVGAKLSALKVLRSSFLPTLKGKSKNKARGTTFQWNQDKAGRVKVEIQRRVLVKRKLQWRTYKTIQVNGVAGLNKLRYIGWIDVKVKGKTVAQPLPAGVARVVLTTVAPDGKVVSTLGSKFTVRKGK